MKSTRFDSFLLAAGLLVLWQFAYWALGADVLSSPAATIARASEMLRTRAFWGHVGKPAAGPTGIHIVATADAQRDTIALWHNDAGRDDLDVELIDLSGRERLPFVMGVIGPERPRELRVELAVRCAQPALSDRGMRVERALEHHFLHVRREYAQHEEKVCIARR